MAENLTKPDSLKQPGPNAGAGLSEAQKLSAGKQLWKSASSQADYCRYSYEEQELSRWYFYNRLKEILSSADKTAMDALLVKAAKILPQQDFDDYRRQSWTVNHYLIQDAICKLVKATGVMPPATNIADETGLSRETVHKHLRQFINEPEYGEILQTHKLMASKVLSVILQQALSGDVKAAKVYLASVLPKQPDIRNQRNTFISINGIEINTTTLAALPPERLNQIAEIIKSGSVQQVEVG